MNPNFKNYLLQATNATECEEIAIMQTLWSGYGKISRYALVGSSLKTVVVKCITLGEAKEHPRGWNTSNSHTRKVVSYQVETYWYENWNRKCTTACRTPAFLGVYAEGNEQWILLEDLDTHFPLRKQQLQLTEVKACLKWLAHFHATFLGCQPSGLWKVGTYWHLETRPDELKEIPVKYQKLKVKAAVIDQVLNNCSYQTIVHGDAKLANFCFSKEGAVSAVDFQYVGGGCGMKDVAYFLGSCLTGKECELYETELLDYYFAELKQSVAATVDFNQLKNEWRRMYPIAVVDFVRFLLGWMPTHQKVNAYSLNLMKRVLLDMG